MLLISGGCRAVLLLLTAAAAVMAGLLVFVQGFLLTRHVILENSTCLDFGPGTNEDCWMPRTFNRTVLLLIDGLRYDFAAYDPSVNPQDAPHYLNKMPVFHEIVNNTLTKQQHSSKERNRDKSRSWRGAGFLSRFIADAPTTTMQRLKALVTGGLPTFIELASNFDSPEISEDNLISQLEQNSRNITVLGDDTWSSLFPHSFKRSFFYPSFNVRDLDTVDNGVLEHLYSELPRQDTQLLVAHFLGVDHAGHRYGPDHPRMEHKLRQLDAVVRKVAEAIADDTLLVVLGDHGMTATGDHGGDSDNEVTAALFVYSHKLAQTNFYYPSGKQDASVEVPIDKQHDASSDVPLDKQHFSKDEGADDVKLKSNAEKKADNKTVGNHATSRELQSRFPRVVQQVSLVPSLSLLIGVPVPYSSIGSVVPVLFGGLEQQLAAVSVNVGQVHRYLKHYNQQFSKNKFPKDMWENLLKIKARIEDLQKSASADVIEQSNEGSSKSESGHVSEHTNTDSIQIDRKFMLNLHEEYLTLAKVMCEEIWATFDVNEMVSGIILMIVTISNMFCIALSLNKQEDVQIYFVKGNCILTIIILSTLTLKHFLHIPVMSYIPALFSGVVVVFHVNKISSLSLYAAYKDFVPIVVFFLICCGSLSNSFVVYEDLVMQFTLISMFVYQTTRIVLVHKNKTFVKGQVTNLDSISVKAAVVAVVTCLCSCAAVRLNGSLYHRCREEQMDCVSSTSYLPLSSVPTVQQNSRFFTGLLMLFLVTYLPRYFLKYSGNLNGTRAAVVAARYCASVSAFMVAAYWGLEAVPKPTALLLSYTNYPPRVVYALVLLAIVIIFVKPLMIFQLKKNTHYQVQSHHRNQIIPELFNNLKASYSGGDGNINSADQSPVVYGLATALSAPVFAVAGVVLLLLVLIVGDGMAVVVLLVATTVAGWSILHSFVCWHNPILDSVMRHRWLSTIGWFVLSLNSFYSLGHQATFPTLPWSAAFIGFDGSNTGAAVSNLVTASLVLLHTYAGHLLLGFLLPLLMLAPLALAAMLPKLRNNRSADDLRRGEFVLVDRPEVCVASITTTAVAYVALHATKVLLSCISSLLLRRHLMVWKIFAPHLVFEAVGLLVTVTSVTAGLMLTFRVLQALHAWATDITFEKIKPL
uniref:GPI ethanolamine phosphate transferase 3-like n=2 Tax=Hirondellea gigas TaxID=1518452 RepID=A0A6A7G4G5_9CRUS